MKLFDFGVQTSTSLHQIGQALGVSEVNLVDDGQHRNFKQNGVQPRALNDDFNFTSQVGCDLNVFFIQFEQAQKIDEITFNESQRSQIGKFVVFKVQAAKRLNFASNFVHIGRQIDTRISALETILDLGTRKLMQNHLHHGEFVEVGVQQTGNDHGKKRPEKYTLQCK